MSTAEHPESVRIIFNDDGSDTFQVDGETVEYGDIAEAVEGIRRALVREGFRTYVSPLRDGGLKGFIREITEGEGDIVFNLCEGAFENSSFEMNVAALLELFSIKFTGSGPMALGLALNKGLTKDVLSSRGVPTAAYVVADDVPVELPEGLDFPLIVKPLEEDASIGIDADAVVYNSAELDKKVELIHEEYSQSALVEEYVDGREFNISILGSDDDIITLPPSEIDFSSYPEDLPKIVCYEAKWITVSPLYIKTPPVCPAVVSPSLADELQRVALEAYEAVGCTDYARVDMRLAADGALKVLEVNPNPDISMDAGFARAAKCAGMEYHTLIGEIVRLAWSRYVETDEPEEDGSAEPLEEGARQRQG